MSTGGYDPKTVEADMYALWESQGLMHADVERPRGAAAGPSAKPYCIVIPPPNVTGALHLGHALNNTLQDVLIRRARMQGLNALWMPGTDHAGIATQAVVERRLREESGWVRDNRNPAHREFLVGQIHAWKADYNARILSQLRKLGCSCDWRRTRFTLDEYGVNAVYQAFFEFFKADLIYRGTRLVNWDTQLQTAVADDEVYHEAVRTHLWKIRYPIASVTDDAAAVGQPPSAEALAEAAQRAASPDAVEGRDYLVVATTRPETLLADTAVGVHPDDVRYRHLIRTEAASGAAPSGAAASGAADKTLRPRAYVALPLTGRAIPVIADPILVKPEFGTGCVKVTPGHDWNDYACWTRNPGIGIRNMMAADGRVDAQNAGEGGRYAGLPLLEARKRIVADLEALGLLAGTEPYETQVGHSDRSKTEIQPWLSEQWFLKMDRLAELAMEAVRDGRTRFFPARYTKTYLDWLAEKRDWCISRQLWWGHRIPVWRVQVKMTQPAARQSGGAAIARCEEFQAALREFAQAAGASDDLVARPSEKSPNTWYVCGRTAEARANLEQFHARCLSVASKESAAKHSGDSPAIAKAADRLRAAIESMEPQDPDVLDTWFSSALWPLSTLGWPHGQNGRTQPAADRAPDALDPTAGDFEYFYPNSTLCTGRGIISLWVARMMIYGLHFTGRVPFRHVYIHPIIMDGQGRTMSKSLGNGVDPLDLIDLYGADAVRFTLASLAGETQDIRIPVSYACPHCGGLTPHSSVVPHNKVPRDVQRAKCTACQREFATAWAADALKAELGVARDTSERFELGRNFCNKLWQAATGFVLPRMRDVQISVHANGVHTHRSPGEMPLFERWIRGRLLACIETVNARLANYEFSAATDALREFFWSDYCDWYLEHAKHRLADPAADPAEKNDVKVTTLQVLDTLLALLHPTLPFVTEAIWQRLSEAIPSHATLVWPTGLAAPAEPPALTVSPWPQADGDAWLRDVRAASVDALDRVQELQSVIRSLRDIRTSINAFRAAEHQPTVRTLPRALIRADGAMAAHLAACASELQRFGQCDAIEIGPNLTKPADCFSRILPGVEIHVPLAGLADPALVRQRLGREQEELKRHIERVAGKLANEGFASRAPAAVVEQERARLAEMRERLIAIEANLADL